MTTPISISEATGYIEFRGYRTWYQAVGDLHSGPAPLLVLHGGPGHPGRYLEPLAALAGSGRPVVLYDQLGCGRSDRPAEDLWTMETFVEEVSTVREALGLDRVCLLGHSWGGWLALEYLLSRPRVGVTALVLASTCASLPAFSATTRALKNALPAQVRDILDRHEAAGTTDVPEYMQAFMAYATRYLCRADPIPDLVWASLAEHEQNEHIYAVMQGPEWNVTGRIKDWDVTDRLAEITVPTLVTSGRFDEMTPELVRPLVEGIPGAQWTIFEKSAHLAPIEEPERYLEVVARFLDRVDPG
jgi:L-proline amide hydrolase